MNIKILLQAFNKPWLIEESAAFHYAGLLHQILNGETTISAGLFDNSDTPYRVNESGAKTADGAIMVIPVKGPIMKNDFCGTLGTQSMANLLQQGNADPSILGFVYDIDSPGGSVDGTEHFANMTGASKKPVVAFGSLMASAAYWVASQCSEIYLSGQTAMVGSIGTMAVIRDMRGFHEKNGVKENLVFATRSSDKWKSQMEAQDGKPEAYRSEYLDPLNNVFESAVKSGRNGKIDLKTEDVATGKVYLGNKAIKAGLADKIGSLETAIRRTIQLSKSQSSNSKNNKMNLTPFTKVLSAANATEFQVAEGGFLVEEKHLTALNAALEKSDQDIAAHTGTIQGNTATITDLNAKLTAANAAKAAADTALATANATIVSQQAELTGLKTNTVVASTVKEGEDDLENGKPKSTLPKFYSSVKK